MDVLGKIVYPKGSHEVVWDREKIKAFWDFYGSNPKFRDWFAGEMVSRGIIKEIEDLLREPRDILEIGFGTGSLIHRLSKMGHRCHGIDSSEEMVSATKNRFQRQKPARSIAQNRLVVPKRLLLPTQQARLCSNTYA